MVIGYDQPLHILPFDHRASFQTGMFGWQGVLTATQTAEISAAKLMIYGGFQSAVAAGVSKEHAGILVDEQFGAAILCDAARHPYITASPTVSSHSVPFVPHRSAHFAFVQPCACWTRAADPGCWPDTLDVRGDPGSTRDRSGRGLVLIPQRGVNE